MAGKNGPARRASRLQQTTGIVDRIQHGDRISSMDVHSSPSYNAPVRPKKLECPSFDGSEITPLSSRTDFFITN